MYNRESKIMRKLLGRTTPDATPSEASIVGSQTPTTFRPSKSQNAVYAAGAPILCFDVSPDKRSVILAGPHVLKAAVRDDAGPSFNFSDGVDLRASITTRQPVGPRPAVVADQLNIRDVKWHGNSTVYTAGASGTVFGYDVTRLAAGDADPLTHTIVQEGSRQINCLDVNPHLKAWLLTGGQDGTARVFDSASPLPARNGISFRQRFAPLRCIDPIRQVKWSPRMGNEVACCTDGGTVLKWDVRQPSRPLLRINAHDKGCSAIAWHADGVHLISAGWDTKLHVWDMGDQDRVPDKRQKPKHTIVTPAPVATVTWRPGVWSASAGARRAAQVAVSYDETSNRRYGTSAVHVWDLARPAMPYKQIERFEASPSALGWQDQDMLWTAGRDGYLNQCDVAFAPKVIDRLSTSAMAFSPRGDVLMFLDERAQSQRPRLAGTQPEAVHRASYGTSPGSQALSASKSDSEDDVVESFLAPRRRARRRRLSGRGVPLSTTPPSAGAFADEARKVLNLEQSIGVTGTFKPQQAMSFGPIPALKPVQLYHFLSAAYLEVLIRELPKKEGGETLINRIGVIMEQYAGAAEVANLYRLAQTWRVLSFAVNLLLKRRAQYHFEVRVGQFQKLTLDDPRHPGLKPEVHENGQDTPRRPGSGQRGSIDGRLHAVRSSLLAEEIESTSNVPTPVARPADTNGDLTTHQQGRRLTPILEPESFELGPSVHGSYEGTSPRTRQDSDVAVGSSESQVPSTEGYDFYDTEEIANAIDVPAPKGAPYRRYARHDSDDSHMFSVSAGTRRSTVRSNSSGDAFARPVLAREQSDFSRDSGATTASPERTRGFGASNSSGEVFMVSQSTKEDPSQSMTDSYASRGLPEADPAVASEKEVSPRHDPAPHVIETDYLPWDDDPAYPFPSERAISSPLNPYKLVQRALDFECKTSALTASAMVLLLRPLMPDWVIDTHRATAILRQQHQRLSRMSLFVEAAMFRNVCVKGWPDGLPDWGDNYTSIFSPSQQGVNVGFLCASCRKPRETDPSAGETALWRCERCRSVVAPCAICGHRQGEAPSQMPIEVTPGPRDVEASDWLSQWWYCPGCAHGGHASCMQLWHGASDASSLSDPSFKYSDGCCPADGCGHACLPGKYRGETTTARADEVGRAAVDSARGSRGNSRRSSPGGGDRVRNDAHDVPQSKAVGMARDALKGGGILSSSPKERERRKSVKFARS